jgi:tripeptide aminopeptidase
MSLGIPAITMSGGGSSSGIHSAKNEWWAPVNAHVGQQIVLLTIPGLAGVRGRPAIAAQCNTLGWNCWGFNPDVKGQAVLER